MLQPPVDIRPNQYSPTPSSRNALNDADADLGTHTYANSFTNSHADRYPGPDCIPSTDAKHCRYGGGGNTRYPSSTADTDTNTNTNTNTDTNTNTKSHTHRYIGSYSNCYGHTRSNSYSHARSNPNNHSHFHPCSYGMEAVRG